MRMVKVIPVLLTGFAFLVAGAEKRPTEILADQADAVVVAEVQSGRQTGYGASFTLVVTRSLKGPLVPANNVTVLGSSGVRSDEDLKGKYGLWFLKRGPRGEWRLLRAAGGQTPLDLAYFPMAKTATPASVTTTLPPATLSDHLVIELAAALPSATTTLQRYQLASGLFGIGNSAASLDVYRALRTRSEPELRFIGLAGLVNENDRAALAEIANSVGLIPQLEVAAGFVRVAVESIRDPEPSAIDSLGKVAQSADTYLQRSAAYALKNIHTRETLPHLARLLDSQDAMAREYAMQGPSRFVDNLPIPTPQTILNGRALIPQGRQPHRTPETDRYSLSRRALGSANEAEYLQFWRSWWTTMEAKVMATTP